MKLNQPPTLRFILWTGFLSVTALLIGTTVYTAMSEAQTRRATGERTVQSISRAIEENLARSFDSSEQMLSDLADTIADRGGIERIGEPALHDLLLGRTTRARNVRGLFVYDAGGKLFASSLRSPVPKLVAPPPHVSILLDGKASGTVIGLPRTGPVSGASIIPMTRALWLRDGKLGGVIGLSLNPEYFDAFYQSLDLGPRVIIVTNAEGELLMRYPAAANPALAQLPPPMTSPAGGAHMESFTALSTLDGGSTLCAFREVGQRPIRIAVCTGTAIFSALWWPATRYHVLITAVALLVASVLFMLILRQLSGLERSEAEKRITKFTLDHVGDIVVWIDSHGHFPFVNPTALKVLGYDAEQMSQLRCHDIFPEFNPANFEANWQRLKKRGQVSSDTTVRTAAGALIPVAVSSNFIEYGGAEYNCAVMRDISARVAAEHALRVSESRYRSMIDALGEGIMVRDRDLILECNPSAERIFGLPRERIIGQKNLSPPLKYFREDGSQFFPHEGPAFLALETGVAQFGFVYGVTRVDGSVIWISASSQPLRLPGSEQTIGTITSYTDFSARKAAEDALRESESRLKTIFDTSPVAIVITAMEDGRILYVNPVTSQMNGYSAGEMIGRTARDIQFWEDDREREQRYAEFFQSGAPFQYEKGFGRKNGSRGVALTSVALIELEGKRRVITIIQDVTQMRAQEAALRESEARFARFFDVSPLAVVISGLEDGRATAINPAFEETFGYGVDEVLGKTSLEIGITVDRPAREQRMELLRSKGRDGPVEVAVRSKDGSIHHMLTSSFVIELSGQQRVVTFFQDISERIRVEENMRRFNEVLERRVAERTAELAGANRELESFSYSVSHDLRSPLRGIDGFSALLVERYGAVLGEQGLGYLGRVRRAATRMGKLIDDLLDLARVGRHELKREKMDISALAATIAGELRLFEAGHPREVSVAPGLTVVADASLIRIALDNILRNAWKFTAHTARPRIEIGVMGDAESVFFVRDNGAGFDMRFSARLFGPFQRLHDTQEFEGTGIGLAIVRRIVQRHGGEIWAEGVVDHGATFYFTLPQART